MASKKDMLKDRAEIKLALSDYKANNEKREKLCNILAKHLLKKGFFGDYHGNIHQYIFDDEKIKANTPINVMYHTNNGKITSKNIRWHIRHKYQCNEPIWNGSFIHGFSNCGRIKWKVTQPSFIWSMSRNLFEMIKAQDIYGGIIREKNYEFYWSSVAAFYLPCDKESLSYIGGLMACVEKVSDGKYTYGEINAGVKKELEKFGVPIEGVSRYKGNGRYTYKISPFWPMLFSEYIPPNTLWDNMKNEPYKGLYYATLCWMLYIGNLNYNIHAIPCLKSRRWWFYHWDEYKKENGINPELKMKKYFERESINSGVIELSDHFKRVVKERVENFS